MALYALKAVIPAAATPATGANGPINGAAAAVPPRKAGYAELTAAATGSPNSTKPSEAFSANKEGMFFTVALEKRAII